MWIHVRPSREVVTYARDFLARSGGLAHRGRFDGDELQQLFGFIAQTIVRDKLGLPRQEPSEGFDGGFDLLWRGKRWDVKCELRNVPMRRSFVHNLVGDQVSYDVDGYIFVSYNRRRGVYTICGFILKDDFLRKASFFRVGTARRRLDGSFLVVRGAGGLFELPDACLSRFRRGDFVR